MSFSIPGITIQNTARDKMIKTCDAYVAENQNQKFADKNVIH